MYAAQVAQQLHYHILDTEMMAAQMTADTLLTDMTHPGPDFTLQVGPLALWSCCGRHMCRGFTSRLC